MIPKIDYQTHEVLTRVFLPPFQKREDFEERARIFNKKFKNKDKKIIGIDVTDSRRFVPRKFAKLKEENWREFDKKWTRPQLRKAIKPYLPL